MRRGEVTRLMRVAIQLIKILPGWQHVFEESAIECLAEISGHLREFRLGLRDGGIQPLPLPGGPVAPKVILPSSRRAHPIHVQRAADPMQTFHARTKIRRGPLADTLQRRKFGKRHRRAIHPHRRTLTAFQTLVIERKEKLLA